MSRSPALDVTDTVLLLIRPETYARKTFLDIGDDTGQRYKGYCVHACV